ncbi:hypothetical protein APASM_5628 [Actinosynnema pretiosum subsp. pretiosum]|nr:hypothetical protein APASM_5628 [Actinosynnema pretiosum subsp. pretiosum]
MAMDPTPKTWRLRFELPDSPGALARVSIRLAARDCNVLALSAIPVPGGVVDELVVTTGPGVLPADLVEEIRAEGARAVGITRADVRDLVDAPAAALRAASAALTDPAALAEALRSVLGADWVRALPEPPEQDGNTAHLLSSDGVTVVARRAWTPFTEVELTRARALAELVGATGASAPTGTVTGDGMAVVIRTGLPSDEAAVAALHGRCSKRSLFARYHAGVSALPRRWLHRLLAPPRGTALVAQCADRVVAIGQLIRTSEPEVAEVSVLVEDEWQRRGIGAALLAQLARAARADGHRELVAWCLPEETGLRRAAERAGLVCSARREDGALRVSIAVRGSVEGRGDVEVLAVGGERGALPGRVAAEAVRRTGTA